MRPQAHVRILIVAVLAIVATIGMLATGKTGRSSRLHDMQLGERPEPIRSTRLHEWVHGSDRRLRRLRRPRVESDDCQLGRWRHHHHLLHHQGPQEDQVFGRGDRDGIERSRGR